MGSELTSAVSRPASDSQGLQPPAGTVLLHRLRRSRWRWSDWPLRWRMAAFVGGISGTVLLGAVLYTGHVLVQGERQVVQAALDAQAEAAATLLANHIRERVIELQVLSQSPDVERSRWPNDELTPSLQRRLQRSPGYRWLALTAADGRSVAVAPAGLRLPDPPLQGTPSASLEDGWVTAVSPPRAARSAGSVNVMPDLEFQLTVRQPGTGARKGSLRARVSGARLMREADAVVKANAAWPDLNWMLVGADGQVLHRSAQRKVTPVFAGDFVARSTVAMGAPQPLGWVVVVHQPGPTALRELRDLQRHLAAGALGAAILVALATYWTARRFSRPIERMAQAVQQVPAMALPRRQRREAPEWRQLATAVDEMTTRLLQQQADLQRLNAGLEQTVAERTQDLARANDELARQADTDALTGLANRRRMQQRLSDLQAEHKRHGRGYGVVLIDADHFKRVNDTHGHAAGDAVLVRLGQVLTGQVRATDLVARYGGEEFVVLVTDDPTHGDLLGVAEKLRAAVAADAGVHGVGPITISLGVSRVGAVGEPVEAALQRADVALYEAKGAGRNRAQAQWPRPTGSSAEPSMQHQTLSA